MTKKERKLFNKRVQAARLQALSKRRSSPKDLVGAVGSKHENKPTPKPKQELYSVRYMRMRCHCGQEYTAKKADYKRGWARSCSKSCAAKRRAYNLKGGRPIKE